MKTFTRSIVILLFSVFLFSQSVYSQYASKRVKSKYEIYTDSIKNVDYNYIFPFWGHKAYKRGIDLQYPVGFMANFFWTTQNIEFDNFRLGFQNAHGGSVDFPLTPVSDSVLGFGNNENTSYSINIRPDIWLFPFIDLYGIFGYGNSLTSVEVLLFPGTPNEQSFTSVVDQGLSTYGLGVLAAGGVGPVWFSLDANVSWNKPALLDKPTLVNVVGIRTGKAFVFKKRPQSNISIWIGTMFVTMQSETVGAVKLADAVPAEVWDNKDAFVANYWDWFNNEATEIQKIFAENYLHHIVNAIDQRNGESIVEYGMDKQVRQHWNGLVGMQYQINKNWQLRAEGGVLGNRKSFLFSLNYRILVFRKPSPKA